MSESQVFAMALKIAGTAERAAYLDQACAGNPQLRASVEALLKAHEADPGFLEKPAASLGGTVDQAPAPAAPGSSPPDSPRPEMVLAGRYKLLEQIGEGGMGSVWMARQTEPVKRMVAVKLLKPGMDGKQVLARFEAERQALALMDHPNIARVYDGGMTGEAAGQSRDAAALAAAAGAGRPFFVMELVKGVPITRFCDENRLTLRQRLELFLPVCQAIQHAHHKGVIHRDIKPSNVLVALYDDGPVPKVIDFGVAKATGGRLTEDSLHTGFGMVVGTVEYMSPEQAGFNQLDVDARSDIYALGVLLYELLTGSPPFSRGELEKAGLMEMLRLIRAQEPPKPSTRLSTAEGLPALAANRGTEPKRLTALVRGELDWIAMKALDKDRARRYDTASSFAADVQRYLNDEPVLACPPSASYRFRKFLRRHKGPVLGITLVLLALLVGVVGTTLGWSRAQAAESIAADRLLDVERANAATTAALKETRTARDALAKALEESEKARKQTLEAKELTDEVTELVVRMLRSPKFIADFDLAARHLVENFRGPGSLKGALFNALGQAYQDLGRAPNAVELFEKAHALLQKAVGPEHNLSRAVVNNLATAYLDMNRPGEALRLLEENLQRTRSKLGKEHPESLTAMNNLATACERVGQLDRAIRLHEETKNTREKIFGPKHPDTLRSMHNLAAAYWQIGRKKEGLSLMEKTLALQKVVLGKLDPWTLTNMWNLGKAYQAQGRLKEALLLFEEALRGRRARLGDNHPVTIKSMNNLATIYLNEAGRPGDAVPLLEEALQRGRTLFGPRDARTIASMNNLKDALTKNGDWAKAEPLFLELLDIRKKKFGPKNISLAGTLADMGRNYLRQKKYSAAEPPLREALKLLAANFPDHWGHFETRSMLGGALLGQKKLTEAEPLLVEGYKGLKLRRADIPAPFIQRPIEALERLIELYNALERKDEAAKWRKELDILKKSQY